MREPLVIMESFDRERECSSYRFSGLVEVVSACSTDDVLPALSRVETAVASGRHAAGFISYEAAPGLNPELTTVRHGEFPLLWFAIFERRICIPPSTLADADPSGFCPADGWRTSVSQQDYAASVEKVREYIAAGDTYQVNLTMRRRCAFNGDPYAFYRDLCRSQRSPFCAYMEVDRFRVLSASPELFFRVAGGKVTTRPMKGTAPRGGGLPRMRR